MRVRPGTPGDAPGVVCPLPQLQLLSQQGGGGRVLRRLVCRPARWRRPAWRGQAPRVMRCLAAVLLRCGHAACLRALHKPV